MKKLLLICTIVLVSFAASAKKSKLNLLFFNSDKTEVVKGAEVAVYADGVLISKSFYRGKKASIVMEGRHNFVIKISRLGFADYWQRYDMTASDLSGWIFDRPIQLIEADNATPILAITTIVNPKLETGVLMFTEPIDSIKEDLKLQ